MCPFSSSWRQHIYENESVPNANAVVEPGWYLVGKGLRIAQLALIVAALALLLVGVGFFVLRSSAPRIESVEKIGQSIDFKGGLFKKIVKGQESVANKMTVSVGMLESGGTAKTAAIAALFVGWCLCCSIPRKTNANKWLVVSVWALGASIVLSLFSNFRIVVLQLMMAGLGNLTGNGEVPILTKISLLLMLLFWLAAYALFAHFISQLAAGYFQQKEFPFNSHIFMAYVGALAIWSIVFVFVFVMPAESLFIVGGITVIMLAVACGWLCFLTTLLLGTLRRAIR